LLSPLSALGVQKQLARLAGVTKAEVYYVAGSATVTFDDAVTDLSAISAVENNVGVFSSPCKGLGVESRGCIAKFAAGQQAVPPTALR
jgi:Cu2+-exporting ATPase